MTKISFDVDFNQDPEKILQEIQKRAEAEVAKREAKDKEANYLSKLHEVVNKEIGTDFKNINALIRALTKYASPAVRDKITTTTPSGRRKTISMSKEIYDDIQTLLAKPNPNKAAIARETGVSVVQVRKVADGGYDKKYGAIVHSGKAPPIPSPDPVKDELPPPALPPISEDSSPIEEPQPTPLPPVIDEEQSEAPSPSLPPIPDSSASEDLAPDLPPPPSFGEDVSSEEQSSELPEISSPEDITIEPPADLPPVPSFGESEESNDLPPPPAPLEEAPPPCRSASSPIFW